MAEFYYPTEPEDYQRLFVKMSIFSKRANKRTADDIIYLPLPIGMLREESGTTWTWRDFGIAGEGGKAIADYMNNNNSFRELRTVMERTGQFFGNMNSAFNTLLEKEMQNTSLESFQALRSGAGYSIRSNATYIFQNINQLREFRFEWTLRPKSRNDSKKIEEIINVIKKASLPEVSDMSAYRELSYFFVDRPEKNDQIGKNDVSSLRDYEHKLYSSTFISPKEFELSLYERPETSSTYKGMKKLEHIVDFPIPFVCQDFVFNMGGEASDADTFIYDPETEEYFSASYFLNLGYLELSHYKSDDVPDYRTFPGN